MTLKKLLEELVTCGSKLDEEVVVRTKDGGRAYNIDWVTRYGYDTVAGDESVPGLMVIRLSKEWV